MSENEPLSYEERLEAVYARLAESAPTNRPLQQIANVGDAVLKMVTTDFGDLMAYMRISRDGADPKSHIFCGYDGRWIPMTNHTTADDLARLVELAEVAEWKQETL